MNATFEVFILTRDEERMIVDCLQSLKLLDAPVSILDSGSTDATMRLASEFDVEIHTRAFDGFASQRNAALELATADWVLFMDADERLTPELCAEIPRAISSAGPEIAAYSIPRRNIAFGRVLNGGGWWPDYQTRLLRRDRCRYRAEHEVHEVVEANGITMALSNSMVHLNYETRLEFIRKQRQYTEMRISSTPGTAIPRRRRYAGAPVREFLRRFVAMHGFRDGLDGLMMAGTLAIEEIRTVHGLRRRRR